MNNPYPSDYTTLDDVITQLAKVQASALDLPASAQTIISDEYDDQIPFLTTLIREVSGRIDDEMNRVFMPYVAARRLELFSYKGQRQSHLPDDLLSVTSMTCNDTAVPSTSYEMYPYDEPPGQWLEFIESLPCTPSTRAPYVTVTGIWGYNPYPDRMFALSGQTLLAELSASATSLVVSDASIFETLQYLRIEDEYLQITAINAATDTLTLSRAVNGTTAAIHAISTAIEAFVPVPQVKQATRRIVVQLYHKRSELGDVIPISDNIVQINVENIRLKKNRMPLGVIR